MYEVEIDRNICVGCGACTKASQIIFLDVNKKANVKGAYVDEDDILTILIQNVWEIRVPASICPNQAIRVYDDDTGDEIEIERNAKLEEK